MRLYFLFLILLTGMALGGCNIVNPAETIPTYIRVDTFTVDPNNRTNITGSVSSHIKSVWVYFNNKAVGIYDLPANVPIATTGPGVVQLVPAVSYSGYSYVRQYPFYESDTFSIPYLPGEATHHTAVTRYRSNANFRFLSDFDLGNKFVKLTVDRTDDTTMMQTKDQGRVFEGAGSGLIKLTSSRPYAEVVSTEDFALPTGESFLEVNHKNGAPVEFGLLTIINGQVYYKYLTGLYANDKWEKTYIALTDFVSQYPNGRYNLIIRTELKEGTEAEVLLDNLKVISF